MKSYPSIPTRENNSLDMIVFDKLDGSNIRAEWSLKCGFYKFGTRKRIIDHNDSHLGKAVHLIKYKYELDLDEIFKKGRHRWQRGVVCFFEFFGPNSFAGQHLVHEVHDVVLFDVAPNRAGIISPREFIKIFGGLDIPAVLHQGRVGPELINKVRESKLEGMTFEGAVCKAGNPNKKKTSQPVMFKIKSRAWLQKLKTYCGEDIKAFERLK